MEAAAVALARVVVDDGGADDRRAACRMRDRNAAAASFRAVAPDRAIDDRHGSGAEDASTLALHRGVIGHGASGDEQSTEAGNTAAPAAAAGEAEVVGHRTMGDDKRAPIENAAAAERDPQDNDEYHQDDPPCTPTWPTASSSSTSAQHRSILHWFESHVRGTPIPGSDFFSVDRRAQCIKRLNRRRGNPSERTRANLDARIRQRERHVPRGVTQSDERAGM